LNPLQALRSALPAGWGTVRSRSRAAGTESFCRRVEHSPRVPVKVRECSSCDDRRVPGLYHMEKIGWVLLSKSAGWGLGLTTSAKFRELEGDDAGYHSGYRLEGRS